MQRACTGLFVSRQYFRNIISHSQESRFRGVVRGQSWLEMTASLPVPCLRHTRTLEHEPKCISTHRQLLEESGREKGNEKSPEFLTRMVHRMHVYIDSVSKAFQQSLMSNRENGIDRQIVLLVDVVPMRSSGNNW